MIEIIIGLVFVTIGFWLTPFVILISMLDSEKEYF